MKTTKNMATIGKITPSEAFAFFSETQIEAIKEIIRSGFWGDSDQGFQDEKIYYAYGYTTNMGKGKEWSGKLSGISKKIESSNTNVIIHCSDYWQDGSGDMMFFNMELLDSDELSDWAKK